MTIWQQCIRETEYRFGKTSGSQLKSSFLVMMKCELTSRRNRLKNTEKTKQ